MKISILFLMIISQLAFGQRKKSTAAKGVETSCQCSKLVVKPSFYYKQPETPNTSYLYLQFDFEHLGMKCKPDFVGTITIFRRDNIKVTILLNTLTSYVDNENKRILVITPLSLPESFRPMVDGGLYRITYSLQYGTTSICPAKTTQTMRFEANREYLENF